MGQADPILHQAGVIAYRVREGAVEVLLLTSRDTGRWLIPKGNIGGGMTPAQAAKREAFEEGGVKGSIEGKLPLGVYTYFKRLPSGESRAAAVEVYLLKVKEQLKKWPEKGERRLAWVSAIKAISLIEEPGVVPLLDRLCELEETLACSLPTPHRRRAHG